jgi:hypothetical protein|tara:strand:+ start:1778 stop:2626 length:849 start_codon:yes stop_codon:yes gene_type:complete
MVEAKREYLAQLALILTPFMIEAFQNIYVEATKLSKGRQTLVMFQKLLKEVPNWSNQMCAEHARAITDQCDFFGILLSAVVVACVKILSAVRLKVDNTKINLSIPENDVFIQTCYNNIAKNLYKDPYIFHEEQNEYTRDEELTKRIFMCIEATVKEFVPVKEILRTYMTQESRQIDVDVDGDVQDTEDPYVYDGSEEMPIPEPEPEPEPEYLPENEPMMDTEEQIQPNGLENEFKMVPGVKVPSPEPMMEPEHVQNPQETREDENVFFDDAPEQRVKKTTYN